MIRELNIICFGLFDLAGKKNYRKLALLMETMLQEYPQELVAVALTNLCGSLRGKPGHDVAVDLMQELFNKIIKHSGASGLAYKVRTRRLRASSTAHSPPSPAPLRRNLPSALPGPRRP